MHQKKTGAYFLKTPEEIPIQAPQNSILMILFNKKSQNCKKGSGVDRLKYWNTTIDTDI
jgi:hypothetical protein